MKTKAVKPAQPGLKVRDPERGRHLKPEGETVPLTSYWRRRLAAREVVPMAGTASRATSVKSKRDED